MYKRTKPTNISYFFVTECFTFYQILKILGTNADMV